MEGLFAKTRDLDQDSYRNIASLRVSQDLFDDLSGGDAEVAQLLAATEMRVKAHIPNGVVQRGFQYSTAIAYPFDTEPFMASRYGDGRYGVWYGALDKETTLYETAWHMVQDETAIEGLHEIVVRERALYQVHCRAILLDLMHKEEAFPTLIDDDYGFTQQIGRRLHHEGHPGLVTPSARRRGGANLVIFNPEVLRDPRVHCYFTYRFDPRSNSVTIEREVGKAYLRLEY